MDELTGFNKVWGKFTSLDPFDVCKRAGVTYDEDRQVYTASSFQQHFVISVKQRQISSSTREGQFLLAIKDYFFDLSLLWYLIETRDVSLSDEMIKPSNVSGGQIFVKGTHVLPLDKIACLFNHRKEVFLEVSKKFGGIETDYGDASVTLYPFPRVPVHLILWFGDENFSPNGQLLLDSSCSNHLSTDVLWAVTMVCCLLYLHQ